VHIYKTFSFTVKQAYQHRQRLLAMRHRATKSVCPDPCPAEAKMTSERAPGLNFVLPNTIRQSSS